MDIIALSAVALLAVVGIAGHESRLSRTDRRLARVERGPDLALDHLGLREEDPRPDEVAALARAGRRVEAIKAYREATGAGPREAKEAVDRLTT
jgi:ribosomal protein L7/L12